MCRTMYTGFVGYDPTLDTVIVSHQGTDPEDVYVLRLHSSFLPLIQITPGCLSSRMGIFLERS